MKGQRIVIAALVAAAALAGPAQAAAQQRARVAVLPFENITTWWGRQLGITASSQLTIKLVNSANFTVVERQKVEAILGELAFAQTGAIDQAKAAQLGKLLGAEYLITGSLTSFNIETKKIGVLGVGRTETKAFSALNARVMNVQTGEIVAAAEVTGEATLARGTQVGNLVNVSTVTRDSAYDVTVAERALGPSVDKLAAALVAQRDRIPTGTSLAMQQLSGTPPSISGLAADGSIYIDQGQNAGIRVGQRFTVVRVVDTIKDAGGNVLDQVTKPVGVIEVTRVLARSAICRVIEGKPGAKDLLQHGDQ